MNSLHRDAQQGLAIGPFHIGHSKYAIIISYRLPFRYIKYNPICDMLITGSRSEERNPPMQIHDELAEGERRLISCSLFMERLINTISTLIDNMESNRIINFIVYWRHMVAQVHTFWTLLSISEQIQSKKFVRNMINIRC